MSNTLSEIKTKTRSCIIFNRKVNADFDRETMRLLRLKKKMGSMRRRAGKPFISHLSFSDFVNPILIKGLKYDNLLAEYQILLSKYTDLQNSQK